jgi:hypothetical protein
VITISFIIATGVVGFIFSERKLPRVVSTVVETMFNPKWKFK